MTATVSQDNSRYAFCSFSTRHNSFNIGYNQQKLKFGFLYSIFVCFWLNSFLNVFYIVYKFYLFKRKKQQQKISWLFCFYFLKCFGHLRF